jgi:bla regulator protein blaR1
MIPSQLLPLANHLWQSTLFAAAVVMLTLFLRKNRAQVRYLLWLAASVKFLIPFSILMDAGSHFAQPSTAAISPVYVSFVIEEVSTPFAVRSPLASIPPGAVSSSDQIPAILAIAWLLGFVTLIYSWMLRWRRMRASVQQASPLNLPIGLPVWTSPSFGEPGVFGILQPVLLMPNGIADCLTARELDAIVTHELCHVRRRDNLAAAIHMAVEAVFWFHPLVWWLGARLVEERERACDEEVLSTGGDPRVYAEGILKTCELYLASPLACVAGVTGGDLKRRIEAIISEHVALRLTFAKKVALSVAAMAALAMPVIVGMVHAPAMRAQSSQAAVSSTASPAPKFDVASIKPLAGGAGRPMDPIDRGWAMKSGRASLAKAGRFEVPFVTLHQLIELAYNVTDSEVLGGPSWVRSDLYEVVAKADGATPQQMRPMLRSLLADRFRLTLRRETRELAVYELAVAKGDLKFAAAKEGSCVTWNPDNPPPPPDPTRPPPPLNVCGGTRRQGMGLPPVRRDRIDAVAVSMSKLIEYVSDDLRGIVIDKTGFTQKFDFHLEFVPGEFLANGLGPSTPGDPVTSTPSAILSGVSIFTALQEQLGLRLTSVKRPIKVLVIDHVERPSGN